MEIPVENLRSKKREIPRIRTLQIMPMVFIFVSVVVDDYIRKMGSASFIFIRIH